jgi:hypothetical protein
MNLSANGESGFANCRYRLRQASSVSSPFRRLFGAGRFANPHELGLLPNRLRRTGRSEHSGARTAHEDGVGLRENCWDGEGVIWRSIPGWSDDGASHRMNCDTPPLTGYCQGTLVPRGERYQTSDLNEIRSPYQ